MGDLIVDTGGALLVSINGYITMKARKKNILTRAISNFMNKNPAMEDKLG